jgi:glycerophosphoryl diester phosphodiesterase
MPEYKVYWLIGNVRRSGKKLIPVTLEYVMKTLRETGSDGVDMRFDPKSVTAEFIKTVKDAGYEFHVWTIDDLELAKMAFERGAQTVTTNNAKKLLDEYRNSEK